MQNSLFKKIRLWLMVKNGARYHQLIKNEKISLFEGLYGRVVEIGSGTGLNMDFLPKEIEYFGIEPNIPVHSLLQSKIDKKGFLKSSLISSGAEGVPIESGSVDFVVSTTVLCSVQDPKRVISEIKRILKPGGKFLFIEHITGAKGSFLRKGQLFFRRPFYVIGGGCVIDRETDVLINDSGFKSVNMKKVKIIRLGLVSPHIIGSAVR